MNNRGISLIEVLLTTALLLVVGSALVRLGVVSLDNSDSSRVRATALNLADEGLEAARSIRDTQVATFFGLSGNYALNSTLDSLTSTNCDPTVLPFVPPGTNSCTTTVSMSGTALTYYRVLRITNTIGVTNSKDVTAYVFWNNKGAYSNVTTSTILTRWRD
jgi:Tfp pilus assembly protein PilV